MNTHLFFSYRLRRWMSGLVASAIMTLSGCDLASTASDGDSFRPDPATIIGKVHGGQFPVYNSTINLYAVGTTGLSRLNFVVLITITN